jgi:spore coat polysaccharide biosynthesis protein SpsF
MATTLAVVEVHPAVDELRPGSPLAGIARRRFGGKSLLEWVVRRVSDAESIRGIAVVAGNDSLAKRLCESCPPDARVFHCEAPDALGRLAEAVRKLPCKAVVRLNVSHPFVDPDLIDRLVGAACTSGCDYASYSFSDGRPVVQSKLGVFAEWCHVDAVLRADRLATSAADRAETTRFIYSRPDLFSQKIIAVPPQLDRDDLRLAIHDEEDWEELQLILDALGPESLDWQYITALLDRQPTIRARMAHRNRAAAEIC